MKTYYMSILDNTHADPVYELFVEHKEAMDHAFKIIQEQCDYYGDLTPDDMEYLHCDGSNGYYLIAQSPCGSFSVKVVDIQVPML